MTLIAPIPSAYHHSRERVLTAYLHMRREGATPWHAMQAIAVQIERYLMGDGPCTGRKIAELEWDLFHARRYLQILDMRRPDFKWWCSKCSG